MTGSMELIIHTITPTAQVMPAWVMDPMNGQVILPLTPHMAPPIMDMVPITMMMDAIFQQTQTVTPMTGNTAQTCHGTPWVMVDTPLIIPGTMQMPTIGIMALITPMIPPWIWVMDHMTGPVTHHTLTPHMAPPITVMAQTTMMMAATFQLTPMPMPMTGNTELICHGTWEMVDIPLIIPGTHPTEWETVQEPGNTAMDLNTMMMDAIFPLTPMPTPMTGNTEPICHGIPPWIWVMDHMTGPVTHHTLTPHMAPPITVMDLIMMMMVATSQQTPIPMPTTGNTALTIHTTWEMVTPLITPGTIPMEWVMDHMTGPVIQPTVTLLTPPLITDMDLIMMMMVATFQPTPIPMLTTGNTELIILGTPVWVMITQWIIPGTHHTEWVMEDPVPGNTAMDLSTMTMVAI